ncbi:MAG TPA: hypothetical protein VK942_07880, partial [Actinomycetes bacterium]|nr:hypothetical protein [Actinomycetes bacterium]
MPMIDVFAAAGTFADPHQLAADLAAAVMTIEQVPDIPMFRQHTAAFVHDLPSGSLSNVDGDSTYVRIQVLTNADALDRGKQLAVVEQLTRIAADAAGDPTLASRTWVLLTEAPDGGWGLDGHANTNQELVAAARAQLASLQAGQPAADEQRRAPPTGSALAATRQQAWARVALRLTTGWWWRACQGLKEGTVRCAPKRVRRSVPTSGSATGCECG